MPAKLTIWQDSKCNLVSACSPQDLYHDVLHYITAAKAQVCCLVWCLSMNIPSVQSTIWKALQRIVKQAWNACLQHVPAKTVHAKVPLPSCFQRLVRCSAHFSGHDRPVICAGTTILVSPYIMHRSHQSWQDPLMFNPSRWHQYQHPKSSSSNASAATASTRAPTASNLPYRPSSSAATATVSNSQLGNRAVSNNGASSSNREVTTAGSVPKQSMRPGTGNLLSGMGPNGAYIPFGAGPRNCIGTGTTIAAHHTAQQHPGMCVPWGSSVQMANSSLHAWD